MNSFSRNYFFVIALMLISIQVTAQPEKVRVGMTQSEFLQVCPNAQRDWDLETEYIKVDTVLDGVNGEMRWSYYNDTIRSVWFRSVITQGPSSIYPKADSAAVHSMRVVAENWEKEIQTGSGKPELKSNALAKVSASNNLAYSAVWKYPGGRTMQIVLRTEYRDNISNAPMSNSNEKSPESWPYSLELETDAITKFNSEKYGVGLSVTQFAVKYRGPGSQIDFSPMPAYTFRDTAVCENAEWGFDFDDGEMFTYGYGADCGTAYGAKSDKEAYGRTKAKAEQLVRDMNMLYGFPDSISNVITPNYEERNSNVLYNKTWLYARWSTEAGDVILIFEEYGGGKSPDVTFSIDLDWDI